MTLYEITGDIKALEVLLENLVDENGEPREPTQEEIETFKQWFDVTEKDFYAKVDNYCRFIKNLRLSADNADAVRKNYKAELDRLSRRSKAFENRANSVQSLLRWSMDRLGIKKYKSDFFNVNIQNTQKSVGLLSTAKMELIPDIYLKPRELDTVAIKEALKSGELIQKEGPENYGKVFYKSGELLEGVSCVQGDTLVIR